MNDKAGSEGDGGIGRRQFLTGTAALGAGAALAMSGVTAARAATRPVGKPVPATATLAVPLDAGHHVRTWMAWPDSTAIWHNKLAGVQANIALIAKTIAKYEPVYLCANAASAAQARSACGSTVTVITTVPVDDCWMRDTGPIFRTNGAGGIDAVGLNFNGWGNKQTHANDALVAGRVAALAGVPFTAAGFTGEGGAIETDGHGTLMGTVSSLVNSNRNPGKSQAQVAAAMCTAYGASKVIWFPGVVGQDITDDHVDATSRFLATSSAVVQLPHQGDTDPFSVDEQQQYQILSTSTGANGAAMAVTTIQGPNYNKIRSTNPDFVGSYANYYVCNGAVISAQFGDTSTDTAAKSKLTSLFPGKVIETLNIDALGAGGGGIHCVTQQQPTP